MGGKIAAASFDVANQRPVAQSEGYPSANGVVVAAARIQVARAFQLQTNPVIGGLGLVVKQRGGFPAVINGDVYRAIVVIISQSGAATHMRFQKILSCLGRNIAKGSFAVAPKKLGHLLKT